MPIGKVRNRSGLYILPVVEKTKPPTGRAKMRKKFNLRTQPNPLLYSLNAQQKQEPKREKKPQQLPKLKIIHIWNGKPPKGYRKPKIRSHITPSTHLGILFTLNVYKTWWCSKYILHPYKGMTSGSLPPPISIRPRSIVAKLEKRKNHYCNTHHQDTMRSDARAVRVQQRERKNERCWSEIAHVNA